MHRFGSLSFLSTAGALCALVLGGEGTAGAQVFGESVQGTMRLDRERSLQRTIDSLRTVIDRLESENYYSTWQQLEGIEPDEEFDGTPILGITSQSDRAGKDYMKEILPEGSVFIEVGYSPAIRDAVEFYSVTRCGSMGYILARYDHFHELFSNTFRHYGIPQELVGLCIVESAVSRAARSKAGAAGMWQFMAETGRDYGLRVTDLVDERYDVILETDAAARYLKALRRELGSWAMAVLAYNCGQERVRQAYLRAGRPDDIWETMRLLPKETQAYLPALIAANYTASHRDALGIVTRRYAEPPLKATVVSGSDLETVAEESGYNLDLLRRINPHLLTGVIPSEGAAVYLPNEKTNR